MRKVISRERISILHTGLKLDVGEGGKASREISGRKEKTVECGTKEDPSGRSVPKRNKEIRKGRTEGEIMGTWCGWNSRPIAWRVENDSRRNSCHWRSARQRSYSMDDISAAASHTWQNPLRMRRGAGSEREREREREGGEREKGEGDETCGGVRARFRVSVPTRRTDGRTPRMRNALLEKGECACRSALLGSRECDVAVSLLPDRCNRGGWTPPSAEAELLLPALLANGLRKVNRWRTRVRCSTAIALPISFFSFFFLGSFFPLTGRNEELDEFLFTLEYRCILDHSRLARIPKEIHVARNAKVSIGPMRDC